MMRITFSVVTAALSLVTVAATAARAQEPPPTRQARPYRGLFGGYTGDTDQMLAFRLSLQQGYNRNVLAEPDPSLQLQTPVVSGGSFTSARAGLQYGVTLQRVSFFVDAGSGARYNARLHEITGLHHHVDARSSMQLTRSTELAVGQSVRYLPYYVFSLLPAAAGLDPTDLDPNDRGVSAKGNIGWVGNVSITQRLARRTSLSASAGISNTYFRSEPSLDLRSADASVRLSHGLTRYSSLRLGYGHQEAHYPGPGNGRFVNRSIDAGIAYNRPLSITRRTTASFGFGTNVYEGVQGTVYRAIGNAHLNREIGQTWRATVGYTRGLGFIQGVPEPYFSDTAHLSFGGLITNRLESAFGASYSTGELGAVLQKNPFTMYSGTASLRYALSRLLAMNIEYGYYRHDFQENTLLPPGVIAVLGRHTVRAGLSVWVPLLTRTRR